MLTSWWSFLLLFVLASAPAIAQYDGADFNPLPASEENQGLIDRLKETPVRQIETGVSRVAFDRWFSSLVKPNRVAYEVQETVECSHDHEYQRRLWIVAYNKTALPEATPWIEIRFAVVDANLPHKAKDFDSPEATFSVCHAVASPDICSASGHRPNRAKAAFMLCEAQASPNIPEPTYPLPRPIPNRRVTHRSLQWTFSKLSELREWVLSEQGKVDPSKVPL